MNPIAVWRALGMAGKGVVVALSLLLILAALWFVTEPGRAHRKALEAQGAAVVSEGQARAAQDAVGIIVDHQKKDAETDQQAKEAEDEIRAAPEDQRTAVALRRLCMSDAARDQQACVDLRKSGSR